MSKEKEEEISKENEDSSEGGENSSEENEDISKEKEEEREKEKEISEVTKFLRKNYPYLFSESKGIAKKLDGKEMMELARAMLQRKGLVEQIKNFLNHMPGLLTILKSKKAIRDENKKYTPSLVKSTLKNKGLFAKILAFLKRMPGLLTILKPKNASLTMQNKLEAKKKSNKIKHTFLKKSVVEMKNKAVQLGAEVRKQFQKIPTSTKIRNKLKQNAKPEVKQRIPKDFSPKTKSEFEETPKKSRVTVRSVLHSAAKNIQKTLRISPINIIRSPVLKEEGRSPSR